MNTLLAWMRTAFASRWRELRAVVTRPRAGGLLLLAAFGIGCVTLFWGNFVDEADNLATGQLLVHDYTLYRDVFSHHFPFAYYWLAAINALFGPSIAAARLSALVFQIVSFAWVMKLTRYWISIGLLSVAWNLIAPLYFGNTVLYVSFSGPALIVVFALTAAIIARRALPGRKELITLGVFSTIALLADPLSIYAVGWAIIGLSASAAKPKSGIKVAGLIAVGLGMYVVYLLATNTLIDFYQSVVAFNTNIYAKYVPADPVRLSRVVTLAMRALNVVDLSWMNARTLNPMSVPDPATGLINNWLFTGFLYRLGAVATSCVLLVRRRFLLAAFVYGFAVMTLSIGGNTFRSTPFVMTACLIMAWLIVGELPDREPAHLALHQLGRLPLWVTRSFIACGLAWLMTRAADRIVAQGEQLSYAANFQDSERAAAFITDHLACGRRDVALAYYPGIPIYNYLTGLPPVSKYLYLWPWVAEVGLSDVIHSLGTTPAIVNFEPDNLVWGRYQTKDYLADLKRYLDDHYDWVGENFYVSPALAQACQLLSVFPRISIPPEIPAGEIVKDQHFTQTFVSECTGLTQVELQLAAYARINTSSLVFRLTDADLQQRVTEQVLAASEVADNQFRTFTFDSLPNSKGHRYRITLSSPDAQPGNGVTIWRSATDVYPGGEAAQDHQPTGGDWVFQYGCRR